MMRFELKSRKHFHKVFGEYVDLSDTYTFDCLYTVFKLLSIVPEINNPNYSFKLYNREELVAENEEELDNPDAIAISAKKVADEKVKESKTEDAKEKFEKAEAKREQEKRRQEKQAQATTEVIGLQTKIIEMTTQLLLFKDTLSKEERSEIS